MYNLFEPLYSFRNVGTTEVRPFIDYKWSNVLNDTGVEKIRNAGMSGVNATSYFGQGVYFDGISQRVDIADALRPTINRSSFSVSVNIVTNASIDTYMNFLGTADVQLMGHGASQLKWNCYSGVEHKLIYPNNLLTGLFALTYDGTTYRAYHNGVLITSVVGAPPVNHNATLCIGGRSQFIIYRQATQKDMFIFNRVLTDAEVMNAYMYPNEFYQMAQADGLCILNMPLCEKDGFVRNYKTYTEVQKEYSNFNNGTTMGFTGLYDATVANVGNKLKVTAVVNNPYTGKQYTAVVGNYYRIRCKILITNSGGGNLIVGSTAGLAIDDLGSVGPGSLNVETELVLIVKATTTILQCNVRGAGMTAGDYFTIDDWEVTDLGTSIYPITNYTAACRTSAQRLTAGLQTSGFKRDTSGTILSKSNYLEGDGVGYADTKWKALKSNFTIEIIQEFSKDGGYHLSGKNDSGRIFLGESYESGKAIFRMKDRIYSAVADSDIVYVTMSYNATSDTFNYYINGVLKGVSDVVGYIDGTLNFLLGNENNSLFFLKKPIKLFKVHTKILSQAEITKNYNKYVAKGLLS